MSALTEYWAYLAVAVVLIPVLGSFTVPLVGLYSKPLRNAWAVLLGVLTTLCAVGLIPTAMEGAVRVLPLPIGLGVTANLVVDGLSVFVACVSSFISTLIIFYSVGYIKEYPYQQEYFLMVVLFLGSMMGLVFSANLIAMFVFWEITGVCSWRLVGFFRDRDIVVKADKTFLMTFGGAVFMLLGFVLIFLRTGTFDLVEMRGLELQPVEVALIVMGIFAKSATLPFHTWLPDAGVAPTPVTALLHAAVLVKIGVYAFARIFNTTFAISGDIQFYLLLLGLLSAGVSACAALVETNIKRILAYSTVSQIGYIFMGLAAFNTIGFAGAVLFILMHGIAKAGLFLCAGIIEHGTGTKDITRLGGLGRQMPITAIAFLLCVLSVVGIPPFGGFYSKSLVISGIIQSGNVAVATAAVGLAVLTATYLLRVFALVFTGSPRDPAIHAHREGTPFMVITVAVLGFLSIVSGLVSGYPTELVNIAVHNLQGNPAIQVLAHEAAHFATQVHLSAVAMPVLIPVAAALLAFLTPDRFRGFRALLAIVATGFSLYYAMQVFHVSGEGPEAVLSNPALELDLDLIAPPDVDARLALVVVGVVEVLTALYLGFLGPTRRRSPETVFYFLFGAGILNAILLAREPVHSVIFGEILFVTLYGAVALLSLLFGARAWSEARMAGAAQSNALRAVKGAALAVFAVIDRGIDALYEKALVGAGRAVTGALSVAHNGLYGNYLAWVIGGFAVLAWLLAVVAK